LNFKDRVAIPLAGAVAAHPRVRDALCVNAETLAWQDAVFAGATLAPHIATIAGCLGVVAEVAGRGGTARPTPGECTLGRRERERVELVGAHTGGGDALAFKQPT
jgi:hypothetical protein